MVHFCYNHHMTDQPDPVVRKTVSLPTSIWKRIEDFQFDHRVKRDSQAIRQLVELGLDAAKESSPADQDKP